MTRNEGRPVLKKKKNRVSKKNKSAWRKHCDTKDVDVYLDDVRHEERVGTILATAGDDKIFYEDVQPTKKVRKVPLTKNEVKLKAKETISKGPKCYEVLESRSCVPVPYKSKEVHILRENPVLKEILDKKRDTKIAKDKETRYKNIRKFKQLRKNAKSVKDMWNGVKEEKIDSEWLRRDTLVHVLKGSGKMKVAVPKSLVKTTSSIPAVEAPHPGTSYNPSYIDHQNLLMNVGEKEKRLLKIEQHLMRVTNNMFSQVTPEKAARDWIKEMSQGLPFSSEKKFKEEKDDGTEFCAVNPPALDKKKTKKTRRNLEIAKKEKYERKLKAIEKKKVADIYKLKKINESLQKTELKSSEQQKKRKEKKNEKARGTKQLSKIKFEEYETEFSMPYELSGNLRNIKPGGSILLERYKSLQKRNILQPAEFQRIRNRGKKKVFIKSSHKIDELDK